MPCSRPSPTPSPKPRMHMPISKNNSSLTNASVWTLASPPHRFARGASEDSDLALPRMEREHRRYFRYEVSLSVELDLSAGELHLAKMSNISEGGLAIRTGAQLPDEALYVQFDLPGTTPEKFRARAVVVWTSNSVAGL